MLKPDLPTKQKELRVEPSGMEIVLAEQGSRALALVLAPSEDLAEMKALRTNQYSFETYAAARREEIQEQFGIELTELLRKSKRFSHSAIFQNRVANLAVLSGDLEKEWQALQRAKEIVDDEFTAHRIGENMLARGNVEKAEAFFSSLNLDRDIYANLRLAFFYVIRGQITRAEERVEHALTIEPFDFNARLFQGGLALFQKKYELAIHNFRLAADIRDSSSSLYANMGIAYLELGNLGKSFSSLKRAVALDPFNANAVILLADLSFRENRNEDAVPSLRYFVQFEQKNPQIWARLARSCLHLGQVGESIQALKRQGALEEKSSVWNNLGVAYQAEGNPRKSIAAFKHAMTLDSKDPGFDYFLAARNVAQYLLTSEKFADVSEFIRMVLQTDRRQSVLQNEVLSDLYLFYVHAIRQGGHLEESRKIAEELIRRPGAANRLIVWAVSWLIAEYALATEDGEPSFRLIREYEDLVMRLTQTDPIKKVEFLNNVAFAYAEFGELNQAEHYLSLVSNALHRHPYSTATLGLLHLRRGHIERGMELYEEAVSLAKTPLDKARIRQKLNLELARLAAPQSPEKAKRLLARVINAKPSEVSLVKQARVLLQTLPKPGL